MRPLILIILPLIFLSILSVLVFIRYADTELQQMVETKLSETQMQFDVLFQDLQNVSNYIGNNASIVNDIKEILRSGNTNIVNIRSYQFLNHIVVTSIASEAKSVPAKQSIIIYFPNEEGRFLSSDRGFVSLDTYYDTSWYVHASNLSKPFFKVEAKNIKQFELIDARKIISLYSLLPSAGLASGSGLIVMNINQSYLENSFGPSITVLSGDQCIINQDVYDSIPANYMQQLLKGDKNHINIRFRNGSEQITKLEDPKYGLTYISIDSKSFYQVSNLILIATVILCVVVMATGIWFIFINHRKNQVNINNIIELFRKAELGEPLPALVQDGNNTQYNLIIHNIISNFVENEYLKVQLSERRYKSRTLELLALQNQINPHFLFNTLDSISWRIRGLLEDVKNPTITMMQDLGALLKYSFAASSTVTLADEIQCADYYTHIQRVRLNEKFILKKDIDSDLMDALVPKMFIQPLIENAIEHGIKQLKTQGIIQLTIKKQASQNILFSIEDNGPGIDPSMLRSLKQKILDLHARDDYEEETRHIGLVNTFRRLILFFGEDTCNASIESKPFESTIIRFIFPYKNK